MASGLVFATYLSAHQLNKLCWPRVEPIAMYEA